MTPTVAVIGPGAIGGAVAGAIVAGGRRPLVAARTPFDEVEVTHPGGVLRGAVELIADPAAHGPVDIVLLAVKAHQTPDVAEWLAALVSSKTSLFVLQNGIEHEATVRPFVPAAATVVPVVVSLPARRVAPGQVVVAARGRLVVPPGEASAQLADLIDTEFLAVRVSEDWWTDAWQKLMINASLGAFGVLTGRDNTAIGDEDGARAFVLGIMDEVAAVARAEGANIAAEATAPLLDRILASGSGHVSSIAVDRLEGRATEWEARNAVVARIAQRHGIAVPLNEMATALVCLGEPQT